MGKIRISGALWEGAAADAWQAGSVLWSKAEERARGVRQAAAWRLNDAVKRLEST